MAIVINGSGTVTGISVGGLPDGIVDSGTLADDAVVEAKIGANAIVTAAINDDAVTNAKVAANAIAEAQLAANAVVTGKIEDGTIAAGDLASGVGGNSVLISTTNVTDGDSYVTLSNVFTNTYDKYVLEGMDFLPNSDNTAIRGNFETGGNTWNTASIYDSQVFALSSGTLACWINVTNGAYGAFAGYGNQGSGSNEQWHFTIEIVQPSSATDSKFWKGSQGGYNFNSAFATILAAGCWRSTTAITGVRFYYHNGGTFKTGKLKLYGVK